MDGAYLGRAMETYQHNPDQEDDMLSLRINKHLRFVVFDVQFARNGIVLFVIGVK